MRERLPACLLQTQHGGQQRPLLVQSVHLIGGGEGFRLLTSQGEASRSASASAPAAGGALLPEITSCQVDPLLPSQPGRILISGVWRPRIDAKLRVTTRSGGGDVGGTFDMTLVGMKVRHARQSGTVTHSLLQVYLGGLSPSSL